MLQLRLIGKRLGQMKMSELSLEVGDGEYFVLLGPSGVGKTVLLEMIAGLIRPDKGKIIWDGKDITLSPPEFRSFAVVYQDYALFPHMSVAANITYGLGGKRGKSSEAKRRVAVLAEMMDIEPLLKRRPGTLSSGEKQRVALARALAVTPNMLLLDEPLSALDSTIALKLRKELKRINKQLGIPVIHVTHNPEEAMALGDRIGVMLGHQIKQVASAEELFRKPSNSEIAEFLGMVNVLAVSQVKDGSCMACGKTIYASSADETISHIWIKPEEILLSTKPFDSSARNQFKCRVIDWDHRDSLLLVRLDCSGLTLSSLITHTSFVNLGIEQASEIYATFKSSSVHCF